MLVWMMLLNVIMQPILTWYETARYAFERGMVWQNLGGVENSLNGGLYHFKEKI